MFNNYSITKVGINTFKVFLDNIPEKLSYTSIECDSLKYSTDSKTATGAINSIKIISGGSNYKKIPQFIGVGGTSSGNFFNAGNTPLNTTFVGSATTNPSRIHSREGAVGIGTDRFTHLGGGSVPSLEVRGATMVHGGFFKVGGISAQNVDLNANSLIDFSEATLSHDAGNSLAPVAYMIVPRGTTAQRNALRHGRTGSTTLLTGSMFYDTDLNKLCVYDNGGWKGVTLGAL